MSEEEEEEEDEDEEDEGEGEGEVQGAPTLPQPPAKRLRKVEPTEPTKLAAAGKSNLARFDTLMLRKTYLDLLNIMPSKLDHNSVTLWRDDVTDEAGALAMLSGEEGGWWVHHFPAAELDHVWRSLVNKHTQNKTLGQVVSLHAPSFAPEADGEVEVRVLVSPQQMAPTELKKAGAALLAVAPSSHNKPHVYFVRGPLAVRDSRPTIEGTAEYKLAREKWTPKDRDAANAAKPPGRPFAVAETERSVYQLYRMERGTTANWVKVDE